LLEKRTDVVEYHLAGGASGGWGATIVHLKPPETAVPASE
jgi:DNA-nicking Smr family endonuclease